MESVSGLIDQRPGDPRGHMIQDQFNLSSQIMFTLSDALLLAKKILIGILVAVIPFIIIFGGLWMTQRALKEDHSAEQTETKSDGL